MRSPFRYRHTRSVGIGEPPDIVEQHREHEVEKPHAIIVRGGLRKEIVLDRLVPVFDLPASAVGRQNDLASSGLIERVVANTAVPSPFVDGTYKNRIR